MSSSNKVVDSRRQTEPSAGTENADGPRIFLLQSCMVAARGKGYAINPDDPALRLWMVVAFWIVVQQQSVCVGGGGGNCGCLSVLAAAAGTVVVAPLFVCVGGGGNCGCCAAVCLCWRRRELWWGLRFGLLLRRCLSVLAAAGTVVGPDVSVMDILHSIVKLWCVYDVVSGKMIPAPRLWVMT